MFSFHDYHFHQYKVPVIWYDLSDTHLIRSESHQIIKVANNT